MSAEKISDNYKNEIKIAKDMGHPYGANKTIWMWIASLLRDCFDIRDRGEVAFFADILGVLWNDFEVDRDEEECRESMLNLAVFSKDEYDEYLKQYGISCDIKDCGTYYQGIAGGSSSEKAQLKELLSDYSQKVAPFVFEKAYKCAEDINQGPSIPSYIFDDNRKANAKKNFAEYIKKYEGLLSSL